jgi:glycosidase
LNNKDDQNFFSTQEEYNKRMADNENKKEDISDYTSLTEKYNKYVDYNEDEEETADDILPSTDENEAEDKSIKTFFKKNNYKNLKILLISVIVAIIVLVGAAVAYLFHVTDGADYGDSGVDYNGEVVADDEDLNLEAMGDITDANSLNDFLYSWANNGGDKMHSKNVLNVLLCGADSKTGTASSGRADAIMLVSINKKTKEIVLTSFFRDSYIYMDIPQKSGGTKGRYEKINAEVEDKDANSVLNFYRKMTKLRHENSTLVYGEFRLAKEKWNDVLAYYRTDENGTFFVELNLTAKIQKKPVCTNGFTLVATNVSAKRSEELVPFEANVYKLR